MNSIWNMTTLDLLITYGLQPACESQWFKNLGLGITECVRKDPFSPTFSRFPGDTQPLKNGLNLPLLVGDLGESIFLQMEVWTDFGRFQPQRGKPQDGAKLSS